MYVMLPQAMENYFYAQTMFGLLQIKSLFSTMLDLITLLKWNSANSTSSELYSVYTIAKLFSSSLIVQVTVL